MLVQALKIPWAFFDDKPSKSRLRNFFKDFGCIILFKIFKGLIRAMNRTYSWPNEERMTTIPPEVPLKKNAHKFVDFRSTLSNLELHAYNTSLHYFWIHEVSKGSYCLVLQPIFWYKLRNTSLIYFAELDQDTISWPKYMRLELRSLYQNIGCDTKQ